MGKLLVGHQYVECPVRDVKNASYDSHQGCLPSSCLVSQAGQTAGSFAQAAVTVALAPGASARDRDCRTVLWTECLF